MTTARLPVSAPRAHSTRVPLTDAERRLVEVLADLAIDAWEREQAANERPTLNDREQTA